MVSEMETKPFEVGADQFEQWWEDGGHLKVTLATSKKDARVVFLAAWAAAIDSERGVSE